MGMKSGSDLTRCQNKDGSLPKRFARMQCFEDAGHESKCRFTMTKEEIDEFFKALDDAGKEPEPELPIAVRSTWLDGKGF